VHSPNSSEIHTPISTEEIARTFDEATAPVDLSHYGVEDWVTLAIFWIMCAAVFAQFFTRYVLNDSFGWTEEVAIFCLVTVVFLGSAMCVRTCRHIQVDFIYRLMSPRAARVLATVVDVTTIVVFGYLAWLVWRYASIIADERMTTIDFPKMPFFMTVFAAFLLMALRALQVMVANIRRGYSALEKPEAFDGSQDDAPGARS
jgi:TRAP-type C4-dicarboxylate transport system permease small subunit